MKIVKNIMSKIKFFCKLVFYPFLYIYFKVFPINIKVISLEKNLDLLKSGRKSLIRYGDGELGIIKGNSLYFQQENQDLAKRLYEILHYEDNNLIIGIPDVFENLNQMCLRPRMFWSYHLFFNQKYYRSLEYKKWGNAFFSRPYIQYKDKTRKFKYFIELKKIWDNRDVVFIEGTTTRNGVGNDLYGNAKSIKRIIGPSENAFCFCKDIVGYVEENLSKDNLILLSLGPAAKIIGFELYKLGFQIIDTGHLDSEYEWWSTGAKKRVPIKGKHTAEITDEVLDNCTDENYNSQIIKKFIKL